MISARRHPPREASPAEITGQHAEKMSRKYDCVSEIVEPAAARGESPSACEIRTQGTGKILETEQSCMSESGLVVRDHHADGARDNGIVANCWAKVINCCARMYARLPEAEPGMAPIEPSPHVITTPLTEPPETAVSWLALCVAPLQLTPRGRDRDRRGHIHARALRERCAPVFEGKRASCPVERSHGDHGRIRRGKMRHPNFSLPAAATSTTPASRAARDGIERPANPRGLRATC